MLPRTLLAAALALGLGFAPSAGALTLADLTGGANLVSADGTLTFSGFEVSFPGAGNVLAGVDLTLFEVEALAGSGAGVSVLEFDGPIVAAGDQVGEMVIRFQVTASPDVVITGAGLQMTATALGTGALASIRESIETGGGAVSLEAIRQAGGAQSPTASASLGEGASSIAVTKRIQVGTAGATALLAQISEFEQSYQTAPIPEPGALAVFGLGLALVARASRPRAA